MKGFQEADQDWLRKLLEGYKPTIHAHVERDREYYAGKVCPECNSACYPIVNTREPFRAGQLTTRCLLQCTYCHTQFEPDTGIIVKFGEAYAPVPTAVDILIPNAEEDPEPS